MARDLLVAAYENNAAHEVVHVLPGSHNMFFKLHLQHVEEENGAFYQVLFCYRDKRPFCLDQTHQKHESEVPTKRSRRKRSVSVVSDSSNANDSDTNVPCNTKHPKRTAM